MYQIVFFSASDLSRNLLLVYNFKGKCRIHAQHSEAKSTQIQVRKNNLKRQIRKVKSLNKQKSNEEEKCEAIVGS